MEDQPPMCSINSSDSDSSDSCSDLEEIGNKSVRAKRDYSDIVNDPDFVCPPVFSKADLQENNISNSLRGIQYCSEDSEDDYASFISVNSKNDELIASLRNLFNELPSVEEDTLNKIFSEKKMRAVKSNNIKIKYTQLSCLQQERWINSDVINFYLSLLEKEDINLCRNNPDRKPSLFFDSYFMESLLGKDNLGNRHSVYSYESVYEKSTALIEARFGKDTDKTVFDFDKIFVVINIGNTHWTLAVLFRGLKEIRYYDSLITREWNPNLYLRALLRWYEEEVQRKLQTSEVAQENPKRVRLNTAIWKLKAMKNTARQRNGFDCGAIVLMNARLLLLNLPASYITEHMSYINDNNRGSLFSRIIRHKIAHSILTSEIH